MNHLHLSRWNNQFANRGVIATIRRKISGKLAGGATVVVYDGDVKGLPDKLREEIRAGWPEHKVVFSTPHPNLEESPERIDDGVRESLIGSRGEGAFQQRVTQLHAFIALANAPRFSITQPPSLVQPGTAYEENTPFARVKVMPGVCVEDAQALFAQLADPVSVNAIAKLGKITLTVGVRPRDRPRKGFTPIFRTDKEKRTLSFLRDDEGRLLVITEGDTARHVARAIAKLQVDPADQS